MCNALVGIELASTMGDEIRNPRRDLPPAIMIAGGASLASYVLVTAAVLALVPLGGLGAIQGIMQAVSAGANNAGIPWIVPPVAVAMGVSVGGAASAWFAGSSRIPFVAGLDSALPRALGRVHPRWHSPYIALATCAGLAAVFTGISLTGSSVAEAYQVLLKASVIIQMIPFIYLFLGLAKLSGVSAGTRIAGALGLFTTIGALIAAFVPAPDVRSLLLFEGKLLVGVLVTVAIGCCLYWRARHSSVGSVVNDAKLPERS
jgi:amino acid transporter